MPYKDPAAKKAHYTAYMREKYRNDPIHRAKQIARVKKRGVEFSLTEDDIVVPVFCPVLGISIAFEDGPRRDSTPSIDRIDPKKGYVPGNVQVVSWRANKIKQDATLDELRAWVRHLEKRDGSFPPHSV